MPKNPGCPNCGAQLALIEERDGQTPPWLCSACVRGWWQSEITPLARAEWDPRTRSFSRTRDGRGKVLKAIAQELWEHDERPKEEKGARARK